MSRAADERHTGHRRPRSPRGEGARLAEEILDAASHLLAEAGRPDAVSVNDIVSAVGCTPPALYLHFPSKDAVFYAVVERHFAEFRATLNEAAVGLEPLDALCARGLAYVEWGLANPGAYRVIFLHSPLRSPGAELGFHNTSAFEDQLAAVQRCIDAGHFPGGDPLEVAMALWAAVHGLAALMITKPSMKWPDRDSLTELVVRAIAVGVDAVLTDGDA